MADRTLSLDGLRAWALLLIARGASTDDPKLDDEGFAVVLSGSDCQEIAQAAIRGDEETVTARVPAGFTRENVEAICRDQG